jgi:hypothetical protein
MSMLRVRDATTVSRLRIGAEADRKGRGEKSSRSMLELRAFAGSGSTE